MSVDIVKRKENTKKDMNWSVLIEHSEAEISGGAVRKSRP